MPRVNKPRSRVLITEGVEPLDLDDPRVQIAAERGLASDDVPAEKRITAQLVRRLGSGQGAKESGLKGSIR